jgi:hypothetical protein
MGNQKPQIGGQTINSENNNLKTTLVNKTLTIEHNEPH